MLILVILSAASPVLQAQDVPEKIPHPFPEIRGNSFKVMYVDRGTAYVDGGKKGGLAPGMKLTIKRLGHYSTPSGGDFQADVLVAILEVTSVSSTSAMCEIQARNQNLKVRPGDIASPLFSDQNKRTRQGPMPAESKPGPLSAPPNAEASRGGYWTTPDQKPQPGSTEAPVLSLAERARLVRGNTAAQDQPAQPQSPNVVAPPPVNAASAADSQRTLAGASVTDTSPSGLPGVNAPAANTGQTSAQASAPEPVLSVAERARLARASRASRDQPAQQAGGQPQSGAGVTTSAASAVTPPAPAGVASAHTSPPQAAEVVASSARAVQQPPPAASTSSPNNAPPALPEISVVATAVKPDAANVTPAPRQPAVPVANAKAASVQPVGPAGTSVSQQPVPASALNDGAKTGMPGAVAPAVSGAGAMTAAAPTTPVMTASISKVGPVGSVTADALATSAAVTPSMPSSIKTTFKVKYVAEDAVYIEGGKDAGLVEGMTLAVERVGGPGAPSNGAANVSTSIAELAVVSVSNTSAVCEIRTKTTDLQRGDIAVLSQADQDKLAQANTLGPTRKYPQVIAFSEGDPLDEEQRETVPKPPLPEVNRARGRIGVDYTFINSSGTTSLNTSQIGGVIRIDMSRIFGTYWNLNGYWRGRMNALTSSTQPQSVYDLVNRTYTLGFTYMNPGSSWTAGVGRLYLPWATSLDTFDGGYLGRRFGKHTIVGAFGGTAPDPTSFNYNPDLRTAGTFVAFEAGSFDKLRFTSTEGIAVSGIGWSENRQFLFNETGLFYKRFFSIYNATQADKQHVPTGGIEEGLSRSFSTLRVQPFSFFSVDVNHNYFRDVPTFSAALVSTGLLDKYLFQGLSVGSRVELPGRISLYGNFGQSSRSGDTHNSLNQLYGVTLGRLWFTGIRADVRYSKFTSSFGTGNYRAASLSRSFKEILRLDVNAGKQSFISSLGVPTDYKLLGSTVDLNVGAHYFIETAFNVQRGLQQSYDQWITTMGYRFDTKRGK
jgi:hypothetical protein